MSKHLEAHRDGKTDTHLVSTGMGARVGYHHHVAISMQRDWTFAMAQDLDDERPCRWVTTSMLCSGVGRHTRKGWANGALLPIDVGSEAKGG